MAQARLKWDQLPQRWRDISAFLPRIATMMEHREHETVSRTEYRVRRGFVRGLDVRVWRQEDLIINVSTGARLGSLLPGIALVVAAVGVACLVKFGPQYGIHLSFPDGVIKRMTYLVLTVGMVLFLLVWGLLAVLIRPFAGRLREGWDEQTILAEITRGLGG
jgi:hypothetical protein